MIPEIMQRLPNRMGTYHEPFVGGGALFFALDGRVSEAVLSDINAELALAYKVIRDDPEPLISLLRQHAGRHTKAFFQQMRSMSHPRTSVELTARFIYLNRTCFNGLYRVNRNGQFNVPAGRYKNPMICDADNLRAASGALQKAVIKIGDFDNLCPDAGDFIYADPPYDQTFNGYNAGGFDIDDQTRLRDASLRWHKSGASVMLSNADTSLIRTLYGHLPFKLHFVSAPRAINSKATERGAVGELLITTYE